MGDSWGNRIRLTIFGESHGPAVGAVLDGLPPGLEVDEGFLAAEMERRAPGRGPLATPRREADAVELLSGVYAGKTTGSAVCGIIRSHNTRSGDYGPIPRPGHADLTAPARYGGHADLRGGGHFSGRLTAPLVFAGALAKLALARWGVAVHGRILAVGDVRDDTTPAGKAAWAAIGQKPFPTCNNEAGAAMQRLIADCRDAGDSIGGLLEVAALGAPPGLGDPFFASVESVAASLFFSIPAVKGVEFGAGFGLAAMRGSQANDAICMENGRPTTATNRCGGILGGLTTGRPVLARLAVKPTPSIALPQQSVDPATGKAVTLETKGRHDPCILPRAVPVAEAALALALLDCLPEAGLKGGPP